MTNQYMGVVIAIDPEPRWYRWPKVKQKKSDAQDFAVAKADQALRFVTRSAAGALAGLGVHALLTRFMGPKGPKVD